MRSLRSMWAEFKAFAFKGNLIDLAVAFVLGAAFTAVVQALAADLLTPIVGAVFGSHDFARLAFHLNGSTFAYGDFLNRFVSFLITAWVLFVVVKAVTRFEGRKPDTKVALQPCPYCRQTIASEATRCPFCTSELVPAAAA